MYDDPDSNRPSSVERLAESRDPSVLSSTPGRLVGPGATGDPSAVVTGAVSPPAVAARDVATGDVATRELATRELATREVGPDAAGRAEARPAVLGRNAPADAPDPPTLHASARPDVVSTIAGVQRQPWPWSSLVLLSGAVFVSVTTELLPTGLLSAMSRDLDVTEGRLGLLVTAYALMVAVLAAPIGMATGRIGRRSLLVVALVGYAVCNAVTAFSASYMLTVGGRLIGGLSHGLFWGMLAGFAGRLVTADRIGRAVTIVSAGGTAAVLVGVPLGTALGVLVGWRAVFGGFAVVALVLAGIGFRLLPDVPGTSRDSVARLRDVIRLPGLAAVILATGLTMLGHFSFITYVAPFLTHAGVPETGLALALLAYGGAGVVGLVLAGILVDRRLRGALVTASLLLASTFTGLALAGGSPALAVSGLALVGVSLGMLPVFLQAATLRAAPTAGDPASALNAATFNIGIGGGALLGGLTLDHGGAAALPVVAAGLSGLGLLSVVLSRRVGALTPG